MVSLADKNLINNLMSNMYFQGIIDEAMASYQIGYLHSF